MEPATGLTIKEVADLLFSARERIDFYWNFYLVVVIAIIGWLVSMKKTLTRPMKWLVTVAYLILSITNFLGLYSAYSLAEALRTDLLRMAASSPLTNTLLILAQHSYHQQRLLAFFIHLAIGAVLLLVVWAGRITEPAETAIQAGASGTKG